METNTIELPKSKDKITFFEEAKGSTIRKIMKALKSQLDLSNIEQGIKIRDGADILMDFAPDLIKEIKKENGESITPSIAYIDNLFRTDYELIESEVNRLLDGLAFI